jgi:integrase
MTLPKGIQVRGKSYIAYCTSKDGKPIRKAVGVVGCCTFKELVRLRADLEKQVQDGRYPPPLVPTPGPETPAVTCTHLWDAYLADCTNREKRVDRLQTAWNHLKLFFGEKAAAEVKTQEMVAYTSERRAAKITNGTINRELAVLKAAMRYGARAQMVERVPMFPKRLKEAKPRQGFVTEKEYAVLAKNAKVLWLRTFLALGFNFGFRKGEMLALRVRNVDLLEGWLNIETSKNGDGRKVKLTQETSTLLAECMRGKTGNDYILTRQDRSKVAQPRKDWYSLCCQSGLGKKITEKRADGKTCVRYDGLQMHDLRRSAVRRLVRCGISEKICMAISGHKTRSVFDRYNITNERDLEQAAKLLEPGQKASVSETENRHKNDTSSFAHS